MGFLIPSALAFAGLALPIIIFYMLKLRRQPAPVSSLMLWQQVVQDRQANAPWQRLKRNILLLLQLLILALLVMALARPYFTVQASVQGNLVLLLDASASMQATDVAPNRFAVAQAAARDVIERLTPDDAVTLIAVESTPRVLTSATTDHSALTRVLNQAQVSNSPADWNAALTLAAANAATLPEATVVIISDGGLSSTLSGANEIEAMLGAIPAPVEFIATGEKTNNQGLIALAIRDGAEGPQLFMRVFNADPAPARRLVEIHVDEQLFDARWLAVPAGDSASLTLSGLPLDARQVRATLNGEDTLAADDVAWAVRSPAPTQILLVGEGNLFLERAMALLPGINLQRADPTQPLPQTNFDLIIFDRVDPASVTTAETDALPDSNLFFIAPPVSTPLFEVSGVMTATHIQRLETSDPILSYVKLSNLRVARAQAITPPPWAKTLIEARGGPLLIAGQTDKQRVAILTFDLHQSDLPLQIDFPILMVNLARWLLPGDNLAQRQTLQADQRFELPTAAAADATLIKTPSGDELSVPADQLTFDKTSDLGIYQVLTQTPDQTEPTLLTEFAVNLLNEAESDIQLRSISKDVAAENAGAEQALAGQREWWWALVGLGLGILLLEWWLYWRGEVR